MDNSASVGGPSLPRRRVRGALLRWYSRNRRDLPWRRSRDPYAIWISETMLQQTRVETVIPYYERFLERFPDVESLAAAEREEVFGLWAGLGYYSRARNLHEAARQLVAEFAGRVPDEAAELRRLPGVGRYTAGAVASIAFDRPEPIVDGNVMRVLTRLCGIREDTSRPQVVKRLWAEAAELARGQRPGDLNQALMELGATVCTPRAPNCPGCPVHRSCDANRQGDAESLPRRAARRKPHAVRSAAVWLTRRGRVLTVRRDSGLLGGLWELPGGELETHEDPRAGLRRHLASGLGLRVDARALLEVGEVRHVFTHRKLRLHVFRCGEVSGRVRRSRFDAHRWLGPDALAKLPQAVVTQKARALIAAQTATQASITAPPAG